MLKEIGGDIMKLDSLNRYTRGWTVGQFVPNLLERDNIEVGIKYYVQNEEEEAHYHKLSQEFTIVVKGKISMNGVEFFEGDIVIVEPNEVVKFKSVTDAICVV